MNNEKNKYNEIILDKEPYKKKKSFNFFKKNKTESKKQENIIEELFGYVYGTSTTDNKKAIQNKNIRWKKKKRK